MRDARFGTRLGKLTVKDIASGTGASEANVKVRVHRAKEMLGKVMKCGIEELRGCEVEKLRGKGFGWVAFRAVMMLAAVDGEIDKEELSLYRELAEKFREGNAADFDALWTESVKGMAYIGFLSEMLEPEKLVREFGRRTRRGRHFGTGADGRRRRRLLPDRAGLRRRACEKQVTTYYKTGQCRVSQSECAFL